MDDIRKDDIIEVTSMGQTVRGVVKSASNWGTTSDPDWYIEFTDLKGMPHYWKQKIDGGTVKKIELHG